MAEKANKLKIQDRAIVGLSVVNEEQKSEPPPAIAPALGFSSSPWCSYGTTMPHENRAVYSYSSYYSSYDDIGDGLSEKVAKKRNSKIKQRAFKPKRKQVSKK